MFGTRMVKISELLLFLLHTELIRTEFHPFDPDSYPGRPKCAKIC